MDRYDSKMLIPPYARSNHVPESSPYSLCHGNNCLVPVCHHFQGSVNKVAGQTDTQHSNPDSENTIIAACPSFILPVLTLFILASSSLGQTLAFAICFCVSRPTLILIIYDSRANIVQIASSRSLFLFQISNVLF